MCGGACVQDLDDILRHGAEELFAEEGADEAAKETLRRKRITYDDAALAALLDREARLKEAEADEEGGGGFMDDFKARFLAPSPAPSTSACALPVPTCISLHDDP